MQKLSNGLGALKNELHDHRAIYLEPAELRGGGVHS